MKSENDQRHNRRTNACPTNTKMLRLYMHYIRRASLVPTFPTLLESKIFAEMKDRFEASREVCITELREKKIAIKAGLCVRKRGIVLDNIMKKH